MKDRQTRKFIHCSLPTLLRHHNPMRNLEVLCSVMLAVLRLPPDHLLGIKVTCLLQMKIHILEHRFKFFEVMSVSILSTTLSCFSIPEAFSFSYWSYLSYVVTIIPHAFSTIYTCAQLRHNDFRIFADPSRIFTCKSDETFKTTSRTLSENMPGHAYGRHYYCKPFLFIPYRQYRLKSDNGQHTNNIHSYLLSNYNIIVLIGNMVS